MASILLAGNPVTLAGDFPEKGHTLKNFTAVQQDLSPLSLDQYKGKKKVLNIFPSIDTDVCAASVRAFNKKAAGLDNTQVICLSLDLPFAHKRFCGGEGIGDLVTGSLYRSGDLARELGVLIMDGPLEGLTARAVIVLDESDTVLFSELVEDIVNEPDYGAALAALS